MCFEFCGDLVCHYGTLITGEQQPHPTPKIFVEDEYRRQHKITHRGDNILGFKNAPGQVSCGESGILFGPGDIVQLAGGPEGV